MGISFFVFFLYIYTGSSIYVCEGIINNFSTVNKFFLQKMHGSLLQLHYNACIYLKFNNKYTN